MKKLIIIPLLFLLFGCNFENAIEVQRGGSKVTIEDFEVYLIDSGKEKTNIYTYTITIGIKNISDDHQAVVIDDFKYSFNDDVIFTIDKSNLEKDEIAIVVFTLTAALSDNINLGGLFFDINNLPMIVYLEDYK